MEYTIREMNDTEYGLLSDFLYEAIFIPDGVAPPPKSILEAPELQAYVRRFGGHGDDKCLVAEVGGRVAGAVWARIMDDYGHIDDDTLSLAISLVKDHRGFGIGTDMMKQMLRRLKEAGYQRASLSVRKENDAVKMYLKVGFVIIAENEEEYIMVRRLQ